MEDIEERLRSHSKYFAIHSLLQILLSCEEQECQKPCFPFQMDTIVSEECPFSFFLPAVRLKKNIEGISFHLLSMARQSN